jgi:hypothetical protein
MLILALSRAEVWQSARNHFFTVRSFSCVLCFVTTNANINIYAIFINSAGWNVNEPKLNQFFDPVEAASARS